MPWPVSIVSLSRAILLRTEAGYPRPHFALCDPPLRMSAQPLGAEFHRQFGIETGLCLHVHGGTDGHLRDAIGLVSREVREFLLGDLLRRKARVQLGFHVLPQPIVKGEFPQSGPASSSVRRTFGWGRPIAAQAATQCLARNGRDRPAQLDSDRCPEPLRGESARNSHAHRAIAAKPTAAPSPVAHPAGLLEPETFGGP